MQMQIYENEVEQLERDLGNRATMVTEDYE
jgi:hypothetical protein